MRFDKEAMNHRQALTSGLMTLKYEQQWPVAAQCFQSFVNSEIDNGVWHDGFQIAVKMEPLDEYELNDLIDALKAAYPNWWIDMHRFDETLRKCLRGLEYSKPTWLAVDDGSVVVADHLQVARFVDFAPLWVTPRVSLDGITLDEIRNETIIGTCQSFDGTKPLRLSLCDGSTLEGELRFQ